MILSELSKGQKGRLKVRTTDLKDPNLKRLQEIGFVDGAPIKLIEKGPFGSPLLFHICGTYIGIRAEEAAYFQVYE
ncbi:MAG: ferrous iron transport protein A [Deltaproteobacteria bacterium]|nr:ferrous iron transport protein A [Deltaproteobacteria bacterium]